jgi:hypothetical protein
VCAVDRWVQACERHPLFDGLEVCPVIVIQSRDVVGEERARSATVTCNGIKSGNSEDLNASTPMTWGAGIEVPLAKFLGQQQKVAYRQVARVHTNQCYAVV